jgi:uncharacterized HAD superfamily protein
MNYKSIAELNADIIQGLHLLPDNVDLIVGIPRSGMLAASILATHSHLPLIDVDGFIQGRPAWFGRTKRKKGTEKVEAWKNSQDAKNPLLFDDSVHSGLSIEDALQSVHQLDHKKKVTTGSVYVKPGSENKIDLYFKKLDLPRIFEWNLMHHTILSQSCVDIDGVLCRDPSSEENDDGFKYLDFIMNVSARHSPSVEIGWLVTSRLEKYRKETEQWLNNNNIKYNNLIMLDLRSGEERRRLGIHASFKADCYKKCHARLFIESSYKQSIEIARISGKCVLCYETGQMVWPDGIKCIMAMQKSRLSYGGWKRFVPEPLRVVYKSVKNRIA